MTELANCRAAFEIRSLAEPRVRQTRARRLRLRPTGDGWSLIGERGELVFCGLGTAGRRACLEFARARGILAVFG
jgi:hypothetical protein